MTRLFSPAPRAKPRRAMTLIEVTLAIAVFSVIICATLSTAGAAISARSRATRILVASQLADALLNEILQQPYDSTDADGANTAAALQALGNPIVSKIVLTQGSSAVMNDYAGYTDSIPINPDGSPSPNTRGYKRSVSLSYVSLTDPTVTSGSDTGLCRVTVSVSFNGIPVLTRVALKANLLPKD